MRRFVISLLCLFSAFVFYSEVLSRQAAKSDLHIYYCKSLSNKKMSQYQTVPLSDLWFLFFLLTSVLCVGDERAAGPVDGPTGSCGSGCI